MPLTLGKMKGKYPRAMEDYKDNESTEPLIFALIETWDDLKGGRKGSGE
jgi:hypothetical protein